MAKGIIYVMSTVVEGLIKIGKTEKSNFKNRMYNLEHNGYCNITGLHKEFAIEVDNYDEKEELIDSLFARSRIANTELFSLNINEVKQLLSSFEGTIIYPEGQNKQKIFNQATEEVEKEEEEQREIRSASNFYDLGLKEGDILTFTKDKNITCVVSGKRKVKYQDEEYALSALASELLHAKYGLNGFSYFTYDNETLWDRRKRLEKEANK